MIPLRAATGKAAALIIIALLLAGIIAIADLDVVGANIPPGDHRIITSWIGSCLTIKGAKNAVIEKLRIGPCARDGLRLVSSEGIVIRDLVIHDTKGNGITLEASSSISIENSVIKDTATSIYVEKSANIQVTNNSFENVRGPFPRGQFVQFNQVSGKANRIACNFGKNVIGQSEPEDAISIYKSTGDADHPIRVEKNVIIGGGPSLSGGGIMLGDGGGQNLVAENNLLVDPGQYGIAIAGGTNLSVLNNEIYGRSQAFTNVGIYVWSQGTKYCDQITVRGNRVRWSNDSGEPNPWWNGGNCSAVQSSDNDFRGASSAEPPDVSSMKPLCEQNLHESADPAGAQREGRKIRAND